MKVGCGEGAWIMRTQQVSPSNWLWSICALRRSDKQEASATPAWIASLDSPKYSGIYAKSLIKLCLLKIHFVSKNDASRPDICTRTASLSLHSRLYNPWRFGRGQAENYIKHLKSDLASDRTSRTTFVANFMRLLEHAAAYVLHQQLRSQVLQHTPLANTQPSTIIAKLFKIAVQAIKYKDRVILHLPSSCPVKQLLKTVTERLFVPQPARLQLSP